ESFPFKAYPGDAHLRHVFAGECAGFVCFEADHLRDLIARVLPFEAGELCPAVVWAFGILHHLPEAFETRVFLSMEDKRRRREIREQTQLVSLRENHFARPGLLRQDFPFGLFRIVYRRPPLRGITRVARGLLCSRCGMRSEDEQKTRGDDQAGTRSVRYG